MRYSYTISLILIILACIMMGFQCNKPYYYSKPIFEFSEKLTLTPYKKMYAVNDTIWIQFQTFDKTLFDNLTNSRVPTDTNFLYVGLYYNKRYPVDNITSFFTGVKIDSVIDMTFTDQYKYNVLQFKTACNSSHYFFKIGFIPLTPGFYSIEPNGQVSNCPNKIVNQYTTFKFTFDLADCNKDVWLSIPPASRGGETGFTDVNIDNKEIFVFKVE